MSRSQQRKPDTSGRETRVVAATIVERVAEGGGFSQHVLNAELGRSGLDARERAFATALVYGTLTWLGPIDAALGRLLDRGLDSVPAFVRSALRVGVYQLRYMKESVPPFAAVDTAVEACARRHGRRIGGMVNGVLRNLQRREDELFAAPDDSEASRLGAEVALPPWIASRILAALGPDEAREAMAVWNAATPVHLRVRTGALDEAIAGLSDAGVGVTRHGVAPRALVMAGGGISAALDAATGLTVQDAGAQIVGSALPSDLGGPILDACAGVGGKTALLLDAHPRAEVVASDLHSRKLDRLVATLGSDRLSSVRWDMSGPAPDALVARGPFDAIVLDAPCSGLGTIGRHPEVRWTRPESAVATLAALQHQMLAHAADLVAPGGWLLFVVCTWTEEETVRPVRALLESDPRFVLEPPTATTAMPDVPWENVVDADGWIRLWPHRHACDGFFAARLRRREETP